MYIYKIDLRNYTPKDVYDGDTCYLWVDLGFHTTMRIKFRLLYINTPEMRGEEKPQGIISRDYVRNKLSQAKANNQTVTIRTKKDSKGKYGRYLCEIFIDNISLNFELIKEGLAKEYI